jgi:hypothetical protein
VRTVRGRLSFGTSAGFGAIFSLSILLWAGCASPGPPRAYFAEDNYARYYATESGRILRVEGDGTVVDVTCLPPEMAKGAPRETLSSTLCPSGNVEILGKTKRMNDDWNLTAYDVAPETGTCKPLLTLFIDAWLEEKRHSCWNRTWEVPAAALLFTPIAVIAAAAITSPIWVPLVLLL